MAAEPAPPDRLPGAPHPRETATLYGHGAAEAAFLDAWRAGRLHHAWLIRGARGVGKATLAYRIARALLAHPDAAPARLAVDPAHPAARQVAGGAHPGLRALVRPTDPKTGRVRTAITVEEARKLKDFFQLSAAHGGWRVVVVDAADEMNEAAANAILKLLEEPPARSVLLLVAHAAGRLPPTIRSRCRLLDLAPLGPADLAAALADAGADAADAPALATLAGGAPGAALALAAVEGPALYARLVALAAGAPGLDRAAAIRLAEQASGREAQPFYAAALELTVRLAERLARAGAGAAAPEAAPGEAALAARLAPSLAAGRLWAETAAEAQGLADRARAVNLDPAQTILDIWLRIDAVAARALDR